MKDTSSSSNVNDVINYDIDNNVNNVDDSIKTLVAAKQRQQRQQRQQMW